MRKFIILLPTLIFAAPKIQKKVSWEKDINEYPLPGQVQDDLDYLNTAYNHMREKVREQGATIRVLDRELHDYMIRTDYLDQRLKALENRVLRKPWYKRMFSCFKK